MAVKHDQHFDLNHWDLRENAANLFSDLWLKKVYDNLLFVSVLKKTVYLCCLNKITWAGELIINRCLFPTPGSGKNKVKGVVHSVHAEDLLTHKWPPFLCMLPWEKGGGFYVLVSYLHPPGSWWPNNLQRNSFLIPSHLYFSRIQCIHFGRTQIINPESCLQ